MINVTVCEMDMVPYRLDRGDYILSLVSPQTTVKQIHQNHKILHFDDITTALPGHREPTEFHIREIIRFASQIPDDANVLIHCHAGISRSPAAAIMVLIEKGLTSFEAFEYMQRVRDQMDPNILMLSLYGQVTEKSESILNAYDHWKEASNKIWQERNNLKTKFGKIK